jgi:hypothetical protein
MTVSSFAEIEHALAGDFASAIATPHSLPTQYPNAPWSEPDSGKWAQLTVLPGETDFEEIGENVRTRTPGLLHINIFTDVSEGDAEGLALADVVADRYRRVERGGVVFRAPSKGPGMRQGRWWMTPVRCPFYADRVV